MNLSDLRQSPHLSASAVSDYLSCGLMYRLGRVDKKKPDFKSDALLFGTVRLHSTTLACSMFELCGRWGLASGCRMWRMRATAMAISPNPVAISTAFPG